MPSDELFKEYLKYLSDNKNKYTGEDSILKERQRIRGAEPYQILYLQW